MKKLVKVIDNKIVSLFEGSDIDYAIQNGFQEKEVERGYDGCWYLAGNVPQKPEELINQEKIEEYKQYLLDTDYTVVKMAEAVATGNEQLLNELKEKYSDIISKREEARENINILEERI